MSDNQYVFEIIRDVGYIIQSLDIKETVWFNVTKDDCDFHTMRSSKYAYTGLSETSRAIEQAYKVTRGYPDKRDIEIAYLKCALKDKE